jgi:RNA polymerase sigma-70 factor (ECF subfamily)
MSADAAFDDLVARLRTGSDTAAVQVVQRFAGRLQALARTRLDGALRRKLDPEDIMQSVFRSFFIRHAAGELTEGSWDNFWTVLALITARKCSNQARHFLRDRRNIRRETAPRAESDDSASAMEFVSREPTPEAAALLTETLEQVMRRLDDRDQQILTLHLQGNDHRAISKETGYAERTVRRVLDHVRHHLEDLQEQAAHEE